MKNQTKLKYHRLKLNTKVIHLPTGLVCRLGEKTYNSNLYVLQSRLGWFATSHKVVRKYTFFLYLKVTAGILFKKLFPEKKK